MSKTKNNVHPGRYKVAGRERQGEDIIHDRQKSMVAESHAMQEHQPPYREHAAGLEEPVPEAELWERAHQDESEAKFAWTQPFEGRVKPVRKPATKKPRAVAKTTKRGSQGAASRARKPASRVRRRTVAEQR